MDKMLDSRCGKYKSHVLQQVIKSVAKLEEFQVKLADTQRSKTHENSKQTSLNVVPHNMNRLL
jgi:xylose isomerase